jgi:hypothetical protein
VETTQHCLGQQFNTEPKAEVWEMGGQQQQVGQGELVEQVALELTANEVVVVLDFVT